MTNDGRVVGRRRALAALAGAGTVGTAGCVFGQDDTGGGSPGRDGDRWPQFLNDAHNSATVGAGPGTALDEQWRWELETVDTDGAGQVLRAQYFEPVAADGTGLTTVSATVNTGTPMDVGEKRVAVEDREHASLLVALDAESGAERWRTPIGYLTWNASLTPVVHDDTVLVTDQRLRAFDLDDGTELWSVDTPGFGRPTLADDELFVPGRSLTSVSAADGSENWSYAEGEAVAITSTRPPAVTDDAVVVPIGSDLVALARETGEQRWRTSVGLYDPLVQAPERAFSPVVHDGRLYVTSGYFLNLGLGSMAALDPADGDVIWRFDPFDRERSDDAVDLPSPNSGTYGTPVVVDETVYAAGYGEGETRLFAVDAATGTHVGTGSIEFPKLQLLKAGDHLYSVGDGEVVAIAPDDLEVVGRFGVAGNVRRPPAVGGGNIVFSSQGSPGGIVAVGES